MAVFETMTSNYTPMNRLEKGDVGVVHAVPEVHLLASLGIRTGKRVCVVTKSFASGPMVVTVEDRSVVVDRSLAAQITVRK